jgi:hypothetical protein
VTLIRRLKVFGWSDERIWREYRIPLPIIKKAKKEILGQAVEEFANKESHVVELAKFEERLKFIIDNMDAIEGLFELISFAKTKGSIPHYVSIINTLGSCLEAAEDDVADLIWKVMRQILRRKPEALNPIMPDFISRLNKTAQDDVIHTLMILSELGGVNPSWIKAKKQFIEQKLRGKFWNERRYAAFAVGSIGSMEPSFVKDVIPTLFEYASDTEKVKKELEEIKELKEKAMRDHDVAAIFISAKLDDELIATNSLRDACIDSLSMIGKRSPESVNAAIPLLEKVSKDASYTRNKAIRILNAIKGMN